jgi:hypothetical protein
MVCACAVHACRERIEKVWEAKGSGTSKWMFNASKFRLADFSYKQEKEEVKEGRNQRSASLFETLTPIIATR